MGMEIQPAKSATVESVYRQVRTATLTQAAAGAFGFLVGFLVMQVWLGGPPALTGVGAALGVVIGAVMTVALDALSDKRERRRHAALYIIGVVVGALLMFTLVQVDAVEPLKPAPESPPATSPAP